MDSKTDVIFTYTREQAIEDGVLVDVSEWASSREMLGRFRIPVAMTAGVWDLVQPPEHSYEDTRGRVHDVLWLAWVAARWHPKADRAVFTVRFGHEDVNLVLHVGPGDQGEPVATIMLPWED